MRKKNLTLMEVAIALSLTAILLSFLLSFYRETHLNKTKIQIAKQQVLANQLVHLRLYRIFAQLHQEEKSQKPLLYTDIFTGTELPALYLQYQNGIDPDPALANLVTSVLYLTKGKELCLTTTSKKGGKRMEILATQISSLSFEFFDPEEKHWTPDWNDKKKATPLIVKMILEDASSKEKMKIEFAFFPISKGSVTI